jgi:coproporphyrinogen III oxidase
MKELAIQLVDQLQASICAGLETEDGLAKFHSDEWVRPEGGGGKSMVIQNGNVFEKGGVNVSKVYGKLPQSMMDKFGVTDEDFFACGVSLVIHPKNPFVPTVHANFRYFEMYNKAGEVTKYWFGGGQDLTPYYFFEEDAIHFHKVCKTFCDRHNETYYEKFKNWCDEYFFNSHRNEARGIGGLFFDYLSEDESMTKEQLFEFVKDAGNNFLACYLPVVSRRKDMPYTPAQRDWQEIRRGRYVEFNLVHDRGTLFGLKTNGRIESILMSLPPHVQWRYDYHPDEGTPEYEMEQVLSKTRAYV